MANAQLRLATQEFRRKFPNGLSHELWNMLAVFNRSVISL